jgi:hypothetical protein
MDRDLDKLAGRALIAITLCTGTLGICLGLLVSLRFP